jgi:hypothetical protein
MPKLDAAIGSIIAAATLLLGTINDANAVPSFARQTDLQCTSCHLSWLELTPTGRQFKLNGYTLGDRQLIPLAGMLQGSWTSTRHVDESVPDVFNDDKEVVLQQASLFLASKWTDHIGSFIQWTYDGVEHHSSIDNVDVRFANRIGDKDHGLVYGLTLNNSPTVQDVYNTVPVWGFPFASSGVSVAPNASTMLEEGLAQQVAGLGAYFFWNKTLYGELSAYHTADNIFSVLKAGVKKVDAARLDGYNPYWRLALQHEWDSGKHSAMVGTYGMTVDKFPDNLDPHGPTDHFKDIALDAQYQYITDKHRASGQLNWIREKQEWDASFPLGDTSNPSDTLKSFKAKATYYYQKKYGINVGYFSTKGGADANLYPADQVTGSATGSPNTSGYVVELNYLPKRDIRLVLQYTGYNKFNGAKHDYDGLGRDASDNNSLYALLWIMI